MYKTPFFAVLILAGTTMTGSVALAASNNKCPPDNWTALDLNHDGYATKAEVEKAAPCIDFSTADTSGDGDFSRVEFLNYQEKSASGKTASKKCLPDNWNALDLNHDGYATKAEVEKVAPCIDFSTADTSGDGDFSRVEFLNYQEGKSKTASSGNAQNAGESNAGQKMSQNQQAQKPGKSGGNIDQSQYHTPMALITNVPKGELRNPFNPHDKAIAKEGQHLFQTHGCSGCHGGDGGGGMCPPLTDDVWSYGSKPDTLFRLITLGSKDLQAKYGYSRNIMQTMQGDMPGMGPTFDHDPKDIWKIITWVESMHLKN